MPLFTRSLNVGRMYAVTLEKLLPGLEKRLGGWLARLEATVAVHEARYGVATEQTSGRPNKLRRPIEADLDAGKPSVILLGARLKSDRRFCETLIRRATTLLGLKRSAPRRGKKRRSVSRLPEYCQR
jgi:hypothetical protein